MKKLQQPLQHPHPFTGLANLYEPNLSLLSLIEGYIDTTIEINNMLKINRDLSTIQSEVEKINFKKRIIKSLNRVIRHKKTHFLINKTFRIDSTIVFYYNSSKIRNTEEIFFEIDGKCSTYYCDNYRINNLIADILNSMYDIVSDLLRFRPFSFLVKIIRKLESWAYFNISNRDILKFFLIK